MTQLAPHDGQLSDSANERCAPLPNALVALLQREFGPDELRDAFGAQMASLQKYWQSALGDPLCALAQRSGKALRSRLLVIAWTQALDLALRVTDLRQAEVATIVRACSELKTGCLMELAARAGAIVAGAEARIVDVLGSIGREFGIVLQMLEWRNSVVPALPNN